MTFEAAIGFIGSGLLLGTGLVIYAHRNFITKDEFKTHRDNIKQRDLEIKEWLVRIETKLDTLLSGER